MRNLKRDKMQIPFFMSIQAYEELCGIRQKTGMPLSEFSRRAIDAALLRYAETGDLPAPARAPDKWQRSGL